MKPKKPTVILPESGAAFAFPIGDGRLSVCRIILGQTSRQAERWGNDAVLAATSAWIGKEIPDIKNAALREILHLNHHSWENKPNIHWLSEMPPPDFVPMGKITPSAEEEDIVCNSFGNWKSLTIQPLIQWRWDNERAALLAEDVIEAGKESKLRQQLQQERDDFLKQVTLDELRDHQFFPNWRDYPSAELQQASRVIMTETIDRLLDLGRKTSKKERLRILKECIESFNELDSELHFIETVEREAICEEFEAIVHACGLGSLTDLADRWREW